MMHPRRAFELVFLSFLSKWTLPRALLVAGLTLVGGLLGRGRWLPGGVLLVVMVAVGLLLLVHWLVELCVERRRHPGPVYLANVILYLLILLYVARA